MPDSETAKGPLPSAAADYSTRFSGIGRLYSLAGMERLRQAHVAIIGVGGVGCWAAEALARSGIGRLTLVDMDDVCMSNTNRQLHALDEKVGQMKIDVMAERIRSINPDCHLRLEHRFYTENTSAELLAANYDYVFDAIDSVSHKAHLIAACCDRNIPIMTCGGAGGRRDPLQIQVKDLAKTREDSLLQQVRKRLRQKHGFPRSPKTKFRVPCVYSEEPVYFPQTDGSVCHSRDESMGGLRLNCDSGFGTATFIVGTFAFVATAHIVAEIAGKEPVQESSS